MYSDVYNNTNNYILTFSSLIFAVCFKHTLNNYSLVIGNAAVNDSFFTSIDNNEWQLYGRIRCRYSNCSFQFIIAFDQSLKGNLL